MQQHSSSKSRRATSAGILRETAMIGICLFGLSPSLFAEAAPEKPSTQIVVRLVNITIPPDSPLRNPDKLSNPPNLYIELFENGLRIGTSTVEQGWQPDFPMVEQNQWKIKNDSKTRYLIKVWDSNWFGDDLAFDISGRKASDLQGAIRERGSVSSSTDRLSTVEFEKVENAKSTGDAPAGP
jgi:hypothetical protein